MEPVSGASLLMAVARLALLLIAACGGAPALPPLAPPVFDGIALTRVECTKHNLLMPVMVDGTLGWFILDSGAFTNVVYESFARRARLVLEDQADRLGGGRGVRVLRVQPRSFVVPGLKTISTPPLFMLSHADSPLAREGCSIAGVISPATLATSDTALLVDFGAARMRQVATAEIDHYLERVNGRRFSAAVAEGEYAPAIDVNFGKLGMRLMIDTGSCCTWVTTSSVVGRAHLPISTPGVAVRRLQSNKLSRRSRTGLQFGDVARTLEIRLLDPDPGDAKEDGAIGGDALHGCVIAIDAIGMRGACRASELAATR